MLKVYRSLLNIGVYDDIPAYEANRVRFANFLEMFAQAFYIFYFVFGIFIESRFFMVVSGFLIIAGALGLYLNKFRYYNLSRFILLSSLSIALLAVCNVLNAGSYFGLFFFPVFVSYALYYDLRHDLPYAAVNVAISLFCAIGSYTFPHQWIMAVNLSPGVVEVIHYTNYTLSIGVTITYIVYIIGQVNKSGRELMALYQESERQRAELNEAKQKAEAAFQAKSIFLSNMSHELRTPLNGIIGTVHLLLQEPMLAEQKEHYNVLKYSSEHMLGLINDVLDFSKMEAGKMEMNQESFNLKKSLNKIYTIFKQRFDEKGIAFDFIIDRSLDKNFDADETKLRQVLTNLIGNALKFTLTGQVVCTARLVSGNSQTAEIYFSVQDTGIGMSKDKQQIVFHAFSQGESATTRRFGGTGLGLAISSRIVQMFCGSLEVSSEEGMGSNFFFTAKLPVSQATTSFVNESRVSTLGSLKGLRVLIAEDSAVNMMIARKFLQRWDVQIVEATNGRKALEQFGQNEFDVLLIDLDMPMMDGYEAVAEIRKNNKSIPAIAFTAAVIPNMKETLTQKGFTDFLQKPFRPEDLHKKIAHYYTAPSFI
jgi:signal transduction histidine kinase